MKQVVVANSGRAAADAAQAWVAESFWERLRGLLGRPRLRPGQALLIRHCSSVHTCFMGYPLDLLFLDGQERVLKAVDSLPPYRGAFGPRGSRSVLELPPGGIRSLDARVGDTLRLD